jgi:hypothetical protein
MKRSLWWLWSVGLLLAGCEAFALQPTPTLTPTRVLSAPTLAASPVVRGEVPTFPAQEFIGQNDPTAAAAASGGDLPPIALGSGEPGAISQSIQLPATDGVLLTGTLYSSGSARVPGVLLLAPDSANWLDLPLRIQAAGFTVLTMNTGSIRTLDDFSVVLRTLSDVGTVDPSGMGVVGAEDGANTALIGCAADLLCDAAALISPTQALGIPMQQFNPRPVFIAAGEADTTLTPLIDDLSRFAQNAARQTGAGTGRGTALIAENPAIGDRLIEWLRDQL